MITPNSTKAKSLSRSMTAAQFDNGYWYIGQIKAFAREIGITSVSKLRKDELEDLIRHFLLTGKIMSPARRNLSRSGIKDVDLGLSLKLCIINYTNDKSTKDFLETEAKKIKADFKKKIRKSIPA